MCSLDSHKNIAFTAELIKYRPAVYSRRTKEKFVYFYVLDPASVIKGEPKLKRIRTKFNRYTSSKERDAAAIRYVAEVNAKLAEGWNPLMENNVQKAWTTFDDIVAKYSTYLNKCKKEQVMKNKTITDYFSRLKMFEEYVREHTICYIYQLDKIFCEGFLDYIYIDRDNSARTRNNYLTWLSSFCSYLVDGGFLQANPCTSIKSLRNGDKFRKALSKEDLNCLEEYLLNNDMFFLLACKFHLYTLIRPNEMSLLKIGDVSLKNQTIYVNKNISKNRKDGVVTLPTSLMRLMVKLGTFDYPSDFYLFGRGFKPAAEQHSSRQFTERWEKIRDILNFPRHYQFYSLKDTGITNIINSVGLNVAKDQARHSSVAITNNYASKDQMHAHPELKNFE